MEFQAEFTPLRAGTIKDLFSQKRSMPVKRQVHDPLGLPVISSQCVHVETEELNEGYDFVRCVNDADFTGRHGWLCAEHGADSFINTRREYRDKDAEIVAGIVAYERRALANAQREVIQVGAKIRIEYVAQANAD